MCRLGRRRILYRQEIVQLRDKQGIAVYVCVCVRVVLCAHTCLFHTVSVVSGGGSGHEPFACGYVGNGLLAGCVSGGVFSSPPQADVLALIRKCCGTAGCLVLVLNYMGDRLNFGAAVEVARAEGLQVGVVFVDDDAALPQSKCI